MKKLASSVALGAVSLAALALALSSASAFAYHCPVDMKEIDAKLATNPKLSDADAARTGQDSQGGIILHEMSHLALGTRDHAYQPARAEALAKDSHRAMEWLLPAAALGAWCLWTDLRGRAGPKAVTATLAWGLGTVVIPAATLLAWIRFSDALKVTYSREEWYAVLVAARGEKLP